MNSEKIKRIIAAILLVACHLLLVTPSYAEVIERIVAIVNDDIILFSEFQKVLKSEIESDNSVSPDRVLNDMIDNMLLLNEAKKYSINVSDKNKKNETDNNVVVGEYIERRIKALIHVPYEDIEHYYNMHKDLYMDKELIEVRDEIEGRLVESELKIKLREHLEELRKKAYVRIQLNTED